MSCNTECGIVAIEILTGIPGLPGSGGTDATSLQGVPIADAAPTTTQTLTYNGTQWVPMTTTAGTY
jgi:hypothetical protein